MNSRLSSYCDKTINNGVYYCLECMMSLGILGEFLPNLSQMFAIMLAWLVDAWPRCVVCLLLTRIPIHIYVIISCVIQTFIHTTFQQATQLTMPAALTLGVLEHLEHAHVHTRTPFTRAHTHTHARTHAHNCIFLKINGRKINKHMYNNII